MGRRALLPPPGGWDKAIGEAIQRIKEEKPLNPQLLRLAKLGRLRLGPTTVAREAGCPRDYIVTKAAVSQTYTKRLRLSRSRRSSRAHSPRST